MASVALDTQRGSELLEEVGFLRVPGRPMVEGRAYLFVALRRRPTLRHFDPERIVYWISEGDRGVRAEIDRSTRACPGGDFAWGSIEVVDRKPVVNRFVSFGGTLSLRRYGETQVAVFSSDVPILAAGGHSQAWDPGAASMAAFIARLRAAAGADRALEARLARTTPVGIYAAFLTDTLALQHGSPSELIYDPRTLALANQEARSLRMANSAEWRSGEAIAALLR